VSEGIGIGDQERAGEITDQSIHMREARTRTRTYTLLLPMMMVMLLLIIQR
jgi:hypothetical protein